MIKLDIILYIILSICMAELAIQIVTSELSEWFKDKLFLQQPYKLNPLTGYTFWFQLFGGYAVGLVPIIIVLMAFFTIHRFVSSLIACSFCTSFWLNTACCYFVLNQNILAALILAPLALVFVAVLNRIHYS